MRTHILGFPSIGKQRELKQVLEAFWKGDLAAEALAETCTALKKRIGASSKTPVLTL